MLNRYLCAMAALAVLCSATSAYAGAGRKLYDRGAKAFEMGEYEAAARLFDEAWAIEPDPAYIFSAASMYRRLGKAEISTTRYERYLEVVPLGERVDKRTKAAGYAAEMRYAMGLEFQAGGDCPTAMVHFERAINHKSDHALAWVSIGECAEAVGDRAGAEVAYRKALEVLPADHAFRKKAGARLEVLRAPPPTKVTPATSATEVPGAEPRPAKKKSGTTLGIVLGVVAGALLVGTVITVVLVAGRSGGTPLEFGPKHRSVMDWESGR